NLTLHVGVLPFRVDLAKVLDLHAFDSLSGISLQKKLQHVPTTQPHLDQNLLWEKNVRNRDDDCMEIIRLKVWYTAYGRNLDKDILKQLFIATVTETEKRWATHFQEHQVCP
ncbi:hypothetical protein Celaphus_00018352, partial [Cervus elaphus hippelaphus]